MGRLVSGGWVHRCVGCEERAGMGARPRGGVLGKIAVCCRYMSGGIGGRGGRDAEGGVPYSPFTGADSICESAQVFSRN